MRDGNAPLKRLEEILLSLSPAEFTSEYMGRKFLHIPGAEGRFSGLFSWKDLERIVQTAVLRSPRLRLVRDGKALEESSYVSRDGSLNLPRMTQLLGQGASLVIDQMDELHSGLSELASGLRQDLRSTIQMNLYAGWRKEKAFNLHWDSHDVLILQLAGRKHWKVYEPTRLHPLKDDVRQPKKPEGEPVWDGILEEGSVLYMPRGWWHVAYPMDEPSLHLTIGIVEPNGIGLLHALMNGLCEHVEVRMGLPMYAGEEEREAYRQRLRSLVTAAMEGDFLKPFEQRYMERQPASIRLDLQNGPARQVKPLTNESRLRWISATPVSLQKDEAGGWGFRLQDRDWACDEAMLPAVRMLSHHRSHSLRELMAAMDKEGNPMKLRMLLAALWMSGALFVDDDPAD